MNWNAQQLEVLEANDKKILVLAGAGSGKTAVLKEKIKRLVENGVKKEEILAISFTNEAKDEMKGRVEKEIGKGVTFLTLHKLGKKMLEITQEKKKDEKIDRQLIFEADKEEVLEQIMLSIQDFEEEKTIEDHERQGKKVKMMINYALSSSIKMENLNNQTINEKQKKRLKEISKDDVDTKVLFMQTYHEYLNHLENKGLMDVSQMITRPIELAKEESIKEIMSSKYKYIFVDEFQDINDKQQELINIISEKAELLFVVGDDYQSIYAFQGSNIQNILNFKKNHPEAREIKLEINYRSTNTIVEASNSVIKNNEDQVKKNMKGVNEGVEQKIYLIEADEKKQEYKKVAKEVKKLVKEGVKKRDIAILYRSNNEKRGMEEALRKEEIDQKIIVTDFENPYRYLFKSYIEFLEDKTNLKKFKEIAIQSNKGIGQKTFEKIESYIETSGIRNEGLIYTVRECIKKINMMKWHKIKSFIFLNDLDELLNEENENVEEIISKITKILKKDKKNDFVLHQINKAEKEIKEKIKEAKTKEELIKSISNSKKNYPLPPDEITIQTVHASKGKEYDVVFILGANESNFPLSYAKTDEQIAEERRLFYVAMTRARKILYISFSKTNKKIKDTEKEFVVSRFVEEIEEKFLEKV